MFTASVFFFILFAFLLFIFGVFIRSIFSKPRIYTEETPFVSVVIPVYNGEKDIVKCIRSVKANKYANKEIIVVDDGSTDGTWELLEEEDIIRFKIPHLGKVEALNYGVDKSKGDLILTIDADTFVRNNFVEKMVLPFSDKSVAATSGAVLVKNKKGLSGMFQNIEYHQNNLIRRSFSKVFSTGIWFFGCMACYRKSSLLSVGRFPKDTLTEDMDIAMVMKQRGYKTINVHDAIGYTNVPTDLFGLFRQRSRWWTGGLQALIKNRQMFSFRSNPSILFLFFNHFWWAFYSFFSLPFFIYQIHYWWPETGIFMYLFRWFSLLGPIYVIYKIPAGWLNAYNFFGVMSGLISVIMISTAIALYKDKFNWRNVLAIFFYFPYTIILNLIMAVSVIRAFMQKENYFIK